MLSYLWAQLGLIVSLIAALLAGAWWAASKSTEFTMGIADLKEASREFKASSNSLHRIDPLEQRVEDLESEKLPERVKVLESKINSTRSMPRVHGGNQP